MFPDTTQTTLATLVALVFACSSSGAPVAVADPAPTATQGSTTEAFDHTHAPWSAVLGAHVKGDDFDYGALKKDPSKLEAYLRTLSSVTPARITSWSQKQRYAFWINAYNAWTIKKVVDSYPLESIRDLSGLLKSVFDDEFIPMKALHPDGDDDLLSLNDIEHEILRPRFKDARVHAAINCASFSCPPLLDTAFVAEKLDEQLDAQMKRFVADPTRNRFDTEDGVLRLSEIFKWFDDDFERDAGSVRDYVARYAPEDKRDFVRKARIKYIDYDWALNDVEEKD